MQEKGEKEESEYVPLPIHTSTGWTKKVAHFQHIISLEPFDINQTDFTIALASLEYCDGVTDLLMLNRFPNFLCQACCSLSVASKPLFTLGGILRKLFYYIQAPREQVLKYLWS